MLTIIRDRIQDMVSKEMTLDEVKAAKPTADYDTEYGNTPGWTSDMFIEAVYKSLGGGKRRRARAAPPSGDERARWRQVGSGSRSVSTARGRVIGAGSLALAHAGAVRRRRHARLRRSISRATGCRSSPTTGDGGW